MSGQRSTDELSPAQIFSVKGYNALVWGGGTGIGLMAAQALVAAGADKVYIAGRRMEALETAAKNHGQGKMIPVEGDLTDRDSIQKIAEQIKSSEGYLNVLVNNSGIAGNTQDVTKGDESAEALQKELLNDTFESWENVYRTNVIGHYFSSVTFLPLLSAATQSSSKTAGCVIEISSISGITNTTQNHYAYNCSKAAQIQLTTLTAQEFSRPGVKVRVNGIAPGIFPSEMTAKESDDKNKSAIEAKGFREDKGIPAGRPGKDVDMAQAVILLATNQYMVGATIVVDGGYLLGNP